MCFFFFQAEDGIRDLVRSRGLGDVYKRQGEQLFDVLGGETRRLGVDAHLHRRHVRERIDRYRCLLYTSDAADERSSVDLGGRRIIKKTKNLTKHERQSMHINKEPLAAQTNDHENRKRRQV